MMTSKSPTMDFDKVSASYGEESKTYLDYNRLFGNKLRFEDFDKAKLSEEDDAHIDSSTSSSSVACDIFAELFAEINSNKFEGAHFLSLLLEKDSMWISGRDRMRNNVLWHVQVPNFRVLLKKTINDLDAFSPTIMVYFANRILFAKKGDSKIYGFNIETQAFETMFHDENFEIDAMCCNDDHLYIFQKKRPDVIQILDSKFQSVGFIPTGFKGKISKCEVDLCSHTMAMNISTQEPSSSGFKAKHQHMCIISMSNPISITAIWHPFVRAVNEAGVIWQVDSEKCPELDDRFNPCSVSTSATGDVFIADNGANRVSKMVGMSTSLLRTVFSREINVTNKQEAVILSKNLLR